MDKDILNASVSDRNRIKNLPNDVWDLIHEHATDPAQFDLHCDKPDKSNDTEETVRRRRALCPQDIGVRMPWYKSAVMHPMPRARSIPVYFRNSPTDFFADSFRFWDGDFILTDLLAYISSLTIERVWEEFYPAIEDLMLMLKYRLLGGSVLCNNTFNACHEYTHLIKRQQKYERQQKNLLSEYVNAYSNPNEMLECALECAFNAHFQSELQSKLKIYMQLYSKCSSLYSRLLSNDLHILGNGPFDLHTRSILF